MEWMPAAGPGQTRRSVHGVTLRNADCGLRISRRGVLASLAALAASARLRAADKVVKNNRLKQSVSRWPYASIPLPDFCRALADIGLPAIDLLQMNEWPVARDHGLVCSMRYAGAGSRPAGLD